VTTPTSAENRPPACFSQLGEILWAVSEGQYDRRTGRPAARLELLGEVEAALGTHVDQRDIGPQFLHIAQRIADCRRHTDHG
jgi:hypothetical protein